MKAGLSEDNLPLSLIRKYCRLLTAYYIAYNEGKDIIQADAWIRKHRSHRGHSELMDNRLEQLYYPYGREEEVIEIDHNDHIITADDIEYINDGTVDDDMDVWMEMLEDYHENGRII
jgi:putative sterol carrier protein